MSAAMPGAITEPEQNEPTVHEWLDHVRAEGDAPRLTATDPFIATTCAAAVDLLEIAASLEASGVSRQVVTDQYGQADVFALADELWSRVPFRSVAVAQPAMWRVGDFRDIARGVLYAAPALMLLTLMRSLGVVFAWWALPLAITWGWALGQVTAHAGYTLRGRQNRKGERVAGGLLMLGTIVSTTMLATLATYLAGGELPSVIGTTCLTVYMVSSAILLLNDQEGLAGRLLAPAAITTVAILVLGTNALPPILVSINIGGSGVATLCAAIRHMRLGRIRTLNIVAGDLRMTGHHLVHGLMCGAALTLVAILGGYIYGESGSTALLALPILCTLGVMEWQLRTFRAGVESLASTLLSLDDFAPRSWALFKRALVSYLLWTSAASVVVGVVVQLDHATPPYILLVSQIALGAVFYVDLTLLSLGRLDLVTRCWINGFGAGLLWWAIGYPYASDTSMVWSAAIVATTITLISLLTVSPGVVSASMSH
jgi:hypothetical protein